MAARIRADRAEHSGVGGQSRRHCRPTNGVRLLERSAAGRRLLKVSALSPLEFVQQEFEHPTVRAGLLFFNGLREVDLRVRGFGHHIAALLASPAKAQMSRGGTAALARALEGGGPRNRRRIPPDDRAEAHRRRKTAAPSASRPPTASSSGRGILSSPRSIRIRPFSIFSMKRSSPPKSATAPTAFNTICSRRCSRFISICASLRDYTASAEHPELARALMVIMGLDHFDQFGDIVRHHEKRNDPADGDVGRVSHGVRSDPGARPACTPASCGRSCPIACEGIPTGPGSAKHMAARCSRSGKSTRPTWPTPSWIHSRARRSTPSGRLPNMREGDLLVGAFTNGQIGYHRPFAGAGSYRTHLPGPVPLRLELPSRRQRDGTSRLQRRPSHPGRPRAPCGLDATADRGSSLDALEPRRRYTIALMTADRPSPSAEMAPASAVRNSATLVARAPKKSKGRPRSSNGGASIFTP